MSVCLDICIIWEESGQGKRRWVFGSSVLHLWAEYIHPAGDTKSYEAHSDFFHPSSYSLWCISSTLPVCLPGAT